MNEKKVRQAVLQARRARKASDANATKTTALEARNTVVGANIYIQDTRPTDPGTWVWIDTTGIDEIE